MNSDASPRGLKTLKQTKSTNKQNQNVPVLAYQAHNYNKNHAY